MAREYLSEEALESSAEVTVSIEDINDNSPVFTRTEYLAELVENAPMGTFVAQVEASALFTRFCL